MSEIKVPVVGDYVHFVDLVGTIHNALVITVWQGLMTNVVRLEDNSDRHDSYGRQIVRDTGVSHVSKTMVHGYYWKWPEEAANPIVKPIAN